MRKFLAVFPILSGLMLAGAPAQADGLAVGAGVSTLGYGIHAAAEVNSFLALRLNGNFGDFTVPDYGLLDSTFGGLDYDIDASMGTIGLLADFHPLGLSPVGGGFVLTGGMYYNQNEFDFTAISQAGDTIGGVPIPPGTAVIANMTFDREFAPYAGLGYDGTFQGVLPVSFFITAGVLFQGSPSVGLTESTGLVPQPALDAEAALIEDSASNFEYYPVVALGLTISF